MPSSLIAASREILAYSNSSSPASPGSPEPGRAPPSADARKQEGARLLQHLACDHQALDLLCAFVDLRDLRVAHEALDRVLLDVAVAAEDLHGIGRHRHRDV